MGGCNGGEGEVFTGITIKDTWTKSTGGGKWVQLGWGEMQTNILEQNNNNNN